MKKMVKTNVKKRNIRLAIDSSKKQRKKECLEQKIKMILKLNLLAMILITNLQYLKKIKLSSSSSGFLSYYLLECESDEKLCGIKEERENYLLKKRNKWSKT